MPFGSGEAKNRFSRGQPWWPSWISYQNDFNYFNLLLTLTLPIKFQEYQPFVSGEEAKNRFSRWWPRRQSWSSHQNNFSYFLSTSPRCFLPCFMSTGLSIQMKRKIDFQDGGHGSLPHGRHLLQGHLGFQIGNILAIVDLQVTRCFLPSFNSIGLWVQEKKRKIELQDDHHGSHPGFPIGRILAISDLQVPQMLPTNFCVNWPRRSRLLKHLLTPQDRRRTLTSYSGELITSKFREFMSPAF